MTFNDFISQVNIFLIAKILYDELHVDTSGILFQWLIS